MSSRALPLAAALLLQAAGALALEEGRVSGAGGTPIHFLRRPGAGAPLVLVHGRSLGAEAFAAWEERLLPGRPLYIIHRRGYAPSGHGPAGATAHLLNAEDVARVVEQAAVESPDGRVGLVAFSLGARFLGAVPSRRLRWVALINPAAVALAPHLGPEQASQAWLLAQGDAASRLWPAAARRDWLRSTASFIAAATERRLREQGADERLLETVAARLASPGFAETLVAETLLGLFGPPPPWRASPAPVLLAVAADDELVPASAYEALERYLSAAGRTVNRRRLPGAHLAPVLDAGPWLREVDAIDASSP